MVDCYGGDGEDGKWPVVQRLMRNREEGDLGFFVGV